MQEVIGDRTVLTQNEDVDVEEAENAKVDDDDSWLYRAISNFTTTIGCEFLTKPRTEETVSTPSKKQLKSIENLQTTAPNTPSHDDHIAAKEDVGVPEVFAQVEETRKQSNNSKAPTASSDEDIDTNADANQFILEDPYWGEKKNERQGKLAANEGDYVQKERESTDSRKFERRLAALLIFLMVVLGAVLAVFLPNWGSGEETKAASSATGPSFAPTTGKPTQEPTSGVPAIVIAFTLDDFPEETSWEVVDVASGMVVQDFPPYMYLPGLKTISHRIEVQPSREYTVTIFDENLDGMCCAEPGDYRISFRDQELASGGGDFGAQVSHTFTIPEV